MQHERDIEGDEQRYGPSGGNGHACGHDHRYGWWSGGGIAARYYNPHPLPLSQNGRGEHEPTAFPPLAAQVANLFQSVAAFVGDGFALVDEVEYRRRLEVCHACDRRAGRCCTEFGCWIGVKARGRAFICPLGRWQ